ncbi:MAG: efflux RND transporter permease subunit [Micropruina sp.]|nr:efflux RND transporter permease subunit [Micropruina sp.]
MKLTQGSLAHRTVVMLLALLVVGMGIYTAGALKQELIPNINIPRATVVSAYLGATPEAVEREVTKPLEDAIKAVTGVTEISSTSISGVSQIRVAWEFGQDADKIQTDIRNAVSGADNRLPADVNPTVVAGSFDDIPIVVLAFSSPEAQAELATKLKDIAVPAFQSLDGVQSVTLAGQETRQVAITLRQKKLDDLGVDVNTLPGLFAANAIAIPSGTVLTGSENLDVQVGRTISSMEEIENLYVQGTDGPVQLREIATVREKAVESTSISRANGKLSPTVLVTKTEAGNTVAVAHVR